MEVVAQKHVARSRVKPCRKPATTALEKNKGRYLGAHVSIQGGVSTAPERGYQIGASAIQIFTKNNNQWAGKPISEEEAKLFRDGLKRYGIKKSIAHDSYLINLGSPRPEVAKKSFEALLDEMQRAELLQLDYLVMHPGAFLDGSESKCLAQIATQLNRILKQTAGFKTMILLETTAGQGSNVGHRFEHLRTILDKLKSPERVGVCFDTCHVFAAGYDLRSEEAYEKTMAEFKKVVGLRKLKAFHLNDSKKDFASRVDRHDHIGKGKLGRKAFTYLMNDKRFAKCPMVLETPKGPDMKEDITNLGVLRRMMKLHTA